MKLRFYISVCLLAISLSGKAQLFSDYNFKFKNYTSRDGLVHNFTRKCRQDSKGFLWIITQNGLSRFDGYNFKNFQHIPGDSSSLPFNDIQDMAIDGDDRIWLGYATGLCYYEPLQKKFVTVKKADQALSLLFDGANNCVWYNSKEKGLSRVLLSSMQVEPTAFKGPYPFEPFCMNKDSKGNLWIGLERHATLFYNASTNQFKYLEEYQWIREVDTDADGNVWLSSWWQGLHSLNIKDSSRKYYDFSKAMEGSNPIIEGIAVSKPITGADVGWVITHNRGLILYDVKRNQFLKSIRYNPSVKSGIINDYNSSIYTDKNGVIWICGWYGLSKINPQEQQFQSAEVQALKTDAYNMLAGLQNDPYDKNIVWLAVTGLGIGKYNRQKEKIVEWYFHNADTEYDWIWAINLIKDKQQRLWAGTYGGLISIDNGKLQKHEIKINGKYTYVEGSMIASNGNIWTWGEAIAEYNPTKKTAEVYKLNMDADAPTEIFGQVQELDSLRMLVTTNKGLYTFNRISKSFTKLSTPGVNPKLTVLEILGGYAFIGGEGGLYSYDLKTGKCERLGEAEGIINLNYGSLLKDNNGMLWIYSIGGLFSYSPGSRQFKKFTTADGIYNNSADRSSLFMYGDDMYIGYRMAYTRFNPAAVDANNTLSIPLIDEVKVNNTPVLLTKDNLPFSLNWKSNTLTVEYTALDYNNSERISFACMLEGFDKEWINLGTRRSVSYNNLPPGNYTFKIKAANSSGIWNEIPASFSFKIIPPLYKRWWFRTLVVLLMAGILFWLYRRRINQLRKKQKEKLYRQQLEIENYKQKLEMEQVTSFFSTSLVNKVTAKEVMNEVAKNLIGKLGFEDCMVYLWNEDKTRLVQYAGHGVKGEVDNVEEKEKYHIPKDKGIIGAAVSSGKPLIVNDTSADSRYITADELIRGSELCVPLKDGEDVIGAINIEHSEKNFFTDYHQQMVAAIAAMMVNKLKAVESTQSLHKKQLELSQTSRQLAETELSLLRSQMNPHFIFNSLNSIQKYIWENKEEDAAEYLASFAKLMRAILENSRKEFVSLKEETDVLKIYTELEHRRSNGRFGYTIRIDETIDTGKTLIPPMLLQPFIENAIWHGLNKKEDKGHLYISIARENNNLVCTVEDDGVGRNTQQQAVTAKKSLGIEITRQRMERMEQDDQIKPSVTIIDKMENGKPAGTRVEIVLPFQTT